MLILLKSQTIASVARTDYLINENGWDNEYNMETWNIEEIKENDIFSQKINIYVMTETKKK